MARSLRLARLALAFLAACAGGACHTQDALDRPPASWREPEPARAEVVRQKDRDGRVRHERHVLVRKGSPPVAHGPERTWYADGAKEWEREFDHGAPSGTWRKWYANGAPESETTFAGPDVEAPMRFWYENGTLSAEGLARDGVRCGRWRFYRPDGALREEGEYVASRREGDWVSVDLDGTRRTVRYERNVIVGDPHDVKAR